MISAENLGKIKQYLHSLLLEHETVQPKDKQYGESRKEIHNLYQQITLVDDLLDTQSLLQDDDINDSESQELLEDFQQTKQQLIKTNNTNHSGNKIVIEIRAGAGGDEASIFVQDIMHMYMQYCIKESWKCEIISSHESSVGLKNTRLSITGKGAYDMLRLESGTHRVQRIPKTESKGRIHTSTITVYAYKSQSTNIEVKIKKEEVRIDTYRASGAGGQHVNTTDSAVRITHLPSGLVVQCQTERSQHSNKDTAFRMLKTQLQHFYESQQNRKIANDRSDNIGSGERSEKIRTYNFPQNRITDHRVGLTIYALNRIVNGDMQSFLDKLKDKFQLVEQDPIWSLLDE